MTLKFASCLLKPVLEVCSCQVETTNFVVPATTRDTKNLTIDLSSITENQKQYDNFFII